ncbi:MAG: cupin domain-containing protein [Deltaproteobacteria bacterium]|nr:cupin domain-containing protein [Deltaproteobacteria bacterium]MBW2015308.1 cupin domain-containing protein [Deltaproteobacteria bacterium]MBW2127842.1 cupin domain-containing protein [Deltaproteobacteria bacterium]MBW2302126.1 cupin domain-containing protein [Deltaproteobacteria bacterium]
MEVIDVADVEAENKPKVILKTLFEDALGNMTRFSFGTVIFEPQSRVPESGDGAHSGDEYTIVVRGRIRTVSGGKEYLLSEGQAAFIPAGERHYAINDSDSVCEIVWLLIEP